MARDLERLPLNALKVFEAVATQGLGVFESLKAAIRRMLLELRKS